MDSLRQRQAFMLLENVPSSVRMFIFITLQNSLAFGRIGHGREEGVRHGSSLESGKELGPDSVGFDVGEGVDDDDDAQCAFDDFKSSLRLGTDWRFLLRLATLFPHNGLFQCRHQQFNLWKHDVGVHLTHFASNLCGNVGAG